MRWAVIENAGYERQYVVRDDFESYSEACRWLNDRYRKSEQERLRTDIAHWDAEQGIWSYDH